VRLSAIRGEGRVPCPSTLAESLAWMPAFASEVGERSLLALDGPDGRRAMRVTRLRRAERPHGFGGIVETVTFLLVDAESGEPGSITVALDEPLTVAVEVPGSVPAELGGGS